MDRVGGKGRGEEEKNVRGRDAEEKGGGILCPLLAKIPAGAHAAGCKTERRFLLL